jgi:hypothetical protein
MNILSGFTLVLLFSSSCGLNSSYMLNKSVNYLGRSYSETKKIDIYFVSETIEKKHEFIGEAFIELNKNSFYTTEEMQNALVKKAKEKGADAIILDEVKRRQGDLIHEIKVQEESSKEKELTDEKIKKKDKNKVRTEKNYREEYISLSAKFIKYNNYNYFKDLQMKAKGEFSVQLKPESNDDIDAGRMTIDKEFTGDLIASSKGQMLSVRTKVEGSATYVAIEHVKGKIGELFGSFSLHHTGIMNRGESKLTVFVIPDSGTEDFTGISGEMTIDIVEGKHFYEFNYKIND